MSTSTPPNTGDPNTGDPDTGNPMNRDMTPVDEAIASMCAQLRPIVAVERVPVRAALGRVLASDLLSPIDVPSRDNSAMDGYAFAHESLTQNAGHSTLQVIGSALAGVPFEGAVRRGECVRIMTGAVMPEGCDTVVMQEVVEKVDDGARVRIPSQQRQGQNRRLRGEDLAEGRAAIAAGRVLTASDIGLAASLGKAELDVIRRPRIGYFSTGDELLQIGDAPVPGRVYDSNRFTLHSLLDGLGVDAIDLGVARDTPEGLEATMRNGASHCDAIISSGGVSVGEADFTRDVMARMGKVEFWTIAMRPGRPMAFGRVGESLYFGLPGNPVAVMITWLFLVRPVLYRLMSASEPLRPMLRARATAPIRKRPGRTEYQRARLWQDAQGRWVAEVATNQGSGVLRSMSEAQGIIVLPHHSGNVQAGDEVDVMPMHGLL